MQLTPKCPLLREQRQQDPCDPAPPPVKQNANNTEGSEIVGESGMCGGGGAGATSSTEIARRLGIDEEKLLSTEGMEKWMQEGGLQSYTKVSNTENSSGGCRFLSP